jgi:addiction module HigA family antidote
MKGHKTMTREEKAIRAATPGRFLQVEFLDEYGISQAELARRTGIPASTINEIVKDKRPINAEVAIALSAFFGNSPESWLNLQIAYALQIAQLDHTADEIRARVQPLAVA